jgi:hypothetical protein
MALQLCILTRWRWIPRERATLPWAKLHAARPATCSVGRSVRVRRIIYYGGAGPLLEEITGIVRGAVRAREGHRCPTTRHSDSGVRGIFSVALCDSWVVTYNGLSLPHRLRLTRDDEMTTQCASSPLPPPSISTAAWNCFLVLVSPSPQSYSIYTPPILDRCSVCLTSTTSFSRLIRNVQIICIFLCVT